MKKVARILDRIIQRFGIQDYAECATYIECWRFGMGSVCDWDSGDNFVALGVKMFGDWHSYTIRMDDEVC